MNFNKLNAALKARGNWGHSGRPGKVGGSTPGSGSSSDVTDLVTVADKLGATRGSTGYNLSAPYGRIELSGTGDQYAKGKSIQVMVAHDESPAYASKRVTAQESDLIAAVNKMRKAPTLQAAADILDGLQGENNTFRWQM